MNSAEMAELSMVRGFGDEFQPRLFVKTCAADPQDPEAGPRFVEAAQVQKAVATAGRFWAPIHLIGQGESGPYYVTPQYGGSVAHLMEQRVAVTATVLYRIIEAVAGGLLQLKQQQHRPHGNLKPSNILLGSLQELEPCEVVLSDPAPSAQAAVVGENGDLYILGQILHLLVVQQPYSPAMGWPAPYTAAWGRLGRHGRNWWGLCNRLLKPDSPQGPVSLEALVAHLPRCRPRRRWPVKRMMAAVAAVALAAVLVWDIGYRRTPEEKLWQQQQTQALGRLGAMENHLASLRQRQWTAPAGYVQSLIERVRLAQGIDIEPAAEELRRAEQLCQRLEQQWSVLVQRQRLLTGSGDTVLASYGRYLDKALESWLAAESLASLGALAERLDVLVGEEPWARAARLLGGPEAGKIDFSYLAQSSPVHQGFGAGSAATPQIVEAWVREVNSGRYDKLTAEADPRVRWAAAAAVRRIVETDLGQLASLYGQDPSRAAPLLEPLRKQADELSQRIKDTCRPELAWSRSHEAQIRGAVGQIDSSVAALKDQVQRAIVDRERALGTAAAEAAALRRRQEAEAFVAECLASTLSAEAHIAAEWQRRNQEMARLVKQDPSRHGEEIRRQRAELKRALSWLDERWSSLPARLDLPASGDGWARAFAARLAELWQAQRQAGLESLLALTRQETATTAPAADAQAAWAQFKERHQRWCAQAAAMLADLLAADRLLAGGVPPEQRPSIDTRSPLELVKAWSGHEMLRDEALSRAAAAVLGPLQELQQAPWQGLLPMIGRNGVPLGVRLGAWHRLYALADVPWPADAKQLEAALGLAEALDRSLQNEVGIESRRSAAQRGVREVARLHWQRFMDRATTAADIEAALGLRHRVVAVDLAALSPRSRFNVMLFDLRRALAKGGAEVTSLLEPFAAAIKALPAELRDPSLTSVAELAARAAAPPTAPDFATLGPLSRRMRPGGLTWRVDADAKGQRVRYWSVPPPRIGRDELELVFRRLEPQGDEPAAYLCTTEVPVGLFTDVITAAEQWQTAGHVLFDYDLGQGDPRAGPRIWEWSAGKAFRRSAVWLSGNIDHYPPQLGTVENRMVLAGPDGQPSRELNPSRRQPMQYVSVQAAIFLADLLGCRLQTVGEWRLAWRQTRPAPAPNLRDVAWVQQRDWVAKARLDARYRPDAGAFVAPDEKPTDDVWTEAAVTGAANGATSYSDGALWFREVHSLAAGGFSHLVGNVAEYAMEPGGRVFVIGASALSTPRRAVDQAVELSDWRNGPRGYSDVGFRLALSLPPRPLDELRDTLAARTYLLGARRP